jgi:hypothetical protein
MWMPHARALQTVLQKLGPQDFNIYVWLGAQGDSIDARFRPIDPVVHQYALVSLQYADLRSALRSVRPQVMFGGR